MARRRTSAVLTGLIAIVALLALAPAAGASIPSVFGGQATCTVAASDGTRECSGKAVAFDGIPIDVNVAFPAAPASGADGNYPLIMVFHGYGGEKLSFSDLRRWTSRGYAAFSMTDRGFKGSCGVPALLANPAGCFRGYVRLIDNRYEVRDAQEFAGALADQDLINPQQIGATGGSYGGGMSMALAALKDRKVVMNTDPEGTLVPWVSPGGKPMRIAAAAPEIPWTDLAYSLAPNGSTLDYLADSPYRGKIGVLKQSFVSGLYALGAAGGSAYYSPPGVDPDADLTKYYGIVNAGEPYDGNPQAQDIIDELTKHHSSYYIDDSVAPAPLLISNGWTDDLFPVDEATRFYNRTRARHPGTPISLYFLDYGHQRGQNKTADVAKLRAREEQWFDFYVRGNGTAPTQDVMTLTQTCPKDAPSGGPFSAPTWADIAPGEVRLTANGAKTIAPAAGDPSSNRMFDPVAGGGACATASATDQPGSANYRLDPAPAGGFTLMGAPTVTAAISSSSPTSQIAGRLLDVGPNGQETLVARGLYRPGVNPVGTREVFQLHANGYRFEQGHIAKLELLPNDAPYSRASNGQGPITVTDLQLKLPVLERPGAADGIVQIPAPKTLPGNTTLAPDFRRSRIGLGKGRIRVAKKRIGVPVRCRGNFGRCTASISVLANFKSKGKKRSVKVAAKPVFYVGQNKSRVLYLKMTKRGRALVSSRRKVRIQIRLSSEAGAVKRTRVAVSRRRPHKG